MKRRVKLTYPQDKIQEPLLFKMAKKHSIMPNIRRARVTDEIGEIVLELEGKAVDLDKGMAFLKKQGVEVELIEGDVIE
jgi:ABC-type methionine transport system ATPase subunit